MFCWFYATLALTMLPETLLAYFIPQSLIGGIVNVKHKESIHLALMYLEKKIPRKLFYFAGREPLVLTFKT